MYCMDYMRKEPWFKLVLTPKKHKLIIYNVKIQKSIFFLSKSYRRTTKFDPFVVLDITSNTQWYLTPRTKISSVTTNLLLKRIETVL